MPREHPAWAVARDGPEYHSVTFRGGPNIHEKRAACGKVARFWPRIGVRMDDHYCEPCNEIVVAAARAEQQTPSRLGGES